MLENVEITGGECFGTSPVPLSDLKPINFIFGPNGSGKTTISRAFKQAGPPTANFSWAGNIPMVVRVYNRDFVDKTLADSSRIPGVFVLGETSADAERRLQEIQDPKTGERQAAQKDLETAQHNLSSAQEAKAEAEETLREIAWNKYKALIAQHPSISPAFSGKGGVGRDSKKLLSGLLEIELGDDEDLPEIGPLLEDAKALFFEDAAPISELPRAPLFRPADHAGYKLLTESIVGSKEVTLSELVDKLGNHDWVAQGQTYLASAHGKCPFCQQTAPKDLARHLADMFDDSYNAQLAELDRLNESFASWKSRIESLPESFDVAAQEYLDSAKFRESHKVAHAELEKVERALQDKRSSPSDPVTTSFGEDAVAALNKIIHAANDKIKDHNRLLTTRQERRPQLRARCWEYLAKVELSTELSKFKKKAPGRAKSIERFLQDVTTHQKRLAGLDSEIRELNNSVESTQPVIDRINEILIKTGFTSFKVDKSPELKNGYRLVRESGEVQEHSLSEGERTFIAFLYFYYLLDARPDESELGSQLLAVIDDPISSLDNDILFVVSTLIRNLIGRIRSEQEQIRQVVVLTHNAYFHKEVTYRRQNEPTSDQAHFLVRKNPGMPSSVVRCKKNPVSTEYARLWREVRRAVDGEEVSIIGLENVMRRILENYFRVLGGIWDEDIALQFEGAEHLVYKSLFNWVNQGSHTIVEDIFFHHTVASQATYVEVFRRIFEATGHTAHYEMMLFGKDSLPISASSQSA